MTMKNVAVCLIGAALALALAAPSASASHIRAVRNSGTIPADAGIEDRRPNPSSWIPRAEPDARAFLRDAWEEDWWTHPSHLRHA